MKKAMFVVLIVAVTIFLIVPIAMASGSGGEKAIGHYAKTPKALQQLPLKTQALLDVRAMTLYFYWTHVGGDPLIPGGVWTTGNFSFKMVNSTKVHQALTKVRRADGLPEWVLTEAYKEASDGNVHSGSIARGAHLGAMSYGRYRVRVVKNTIYKGQYSRLPIFYVIVSKTSDKQIGDKHYRQTVSYWVSMAKPCGNVFIFHKRVKLQRLYELRVEKRLDCVTGPRMPDWTISGTVDSRVVTTTTLSTDSVSIGFFLPGTKYDLSEVQQTGYQVVSPEDGRYFGKMPNHDLTLVYVNKKVSTPTPTPTCTPTPTPTPTCTPTPTPTPTPSHELVISAEMVPLEHIDASHIRVNFIVTVLEHSDNDSLEFIWFWNENTATTSLYTYPVVLNYNTVYQVSVIARDALGHEAQATLPPFNIVGPGEPPNLSPQVRNVVYIE